MLPEVEDQPHWYLRINGSPALIDGGNEIPLGRKSAALLVFLALHGPTSRARLAQLLWPDQEAQQARRDLRGLLFTLKRFDGLLSAGDPLQLGVSVQLRPGYLDETLLAGLDYDALPEFSEWLAYQRRVIKERHTEWLISEVRRFEQEGRFAEAVTIGRQLADHEPLSETTRRTLMRLLYLSGDRAAALTAYRDWQELLQRELGVTPEAETKALAHTIEQGTRLPDTPRNRHKEIPLAVAQPPLLAGREREWREMEAAWQRGQVIFIAGPAGVGKSRLMLDFARSKGTFLCLRGRPGQSTVPFGSCAPFIRDILASVLPPGLNIKPWVRRDLARLVPELMEGSYLPFRSEEDARCVIDAISALVTQTRGYLTTVLTDDLHFLDLDSLRTGSRVIADHARFDHSTGHRIFAAMRLEELNQEYVKEIRAMVESGVAVLIELEPLDLDGVRQMVKGMELPELPLLTEPLYKLTGGNPLFIVETLKSLIESGELRRCAIKNVLPKRVSMVLEGRFRRLSKEAYWLLELRAVAQEDFSLELAAQALELSPLMVAEHLAELEAARMMTQNDFSHDLIYEAVRRTVPNALLTYFHMACATFLEAREGEPARVAFHFWEAREVSRALPFYLQAVGVALNQGAFVQARAWLDRVLAHTPREDYLHAEAEERLKRILDIL